MMCQNVGLIINMSYKIAKRIIFAQAEKNYGQDKIKSC